MSRSCPRLRCFVPVLLAGALIFPGAFRLAGQDDVVNTPPEAPPPPPPRGAPAKPAAPEPTSATLAEVAQALEIFFQLGLPETKGAKWVRAQGAGIGEVIADPYGNFSNQGGTAWLVREEADGTVELVINQSRVLKAKKVAASGGRAARPVAKPGELPPVQITPADLAKDLKAMKVGWERSAARMQQQKAAGGNDDDDDDENSYARFSSFGDNPRGGAGNALLLLAHLQRQGNADAVRDALPAVLKLSGTSEKALDAAISALADGRLAVLTEQWARDGDPNAYAEAIDKLAAEFSRGWANRAAAQMLAQRARRQTPAEKAEDPRAQAAATLLLGLRAEQFAELPVNQNWLLPGSTGRRGMGRGWSNFPPMSTIEEPAELSTDEEEDEDAPKKPKAEPADKTLSPVRAFFAKPREAAAALALLLGDQRLLHSAGRATQDGSYSYNSGNPESMLKVQYTQLPRPMELGELAEALLKGLLPEKMTNRYDSNLSGEAVREWVESIASLSDEELAWNYLRNAGRSSNDEFGLALNYLVEKGSPQTIQKLQEVFFDPAVWRGNFDGMLGYVEAYLKKMPGDPAAFGEKLKGAAKASLATEREDRARYQSEMPDSYVKMQEKQEQAQLKKIDQFFKQTSLAEALAEIVPVEETEAYALLQNLQPIVARTPPEQVEAQMLQAAAKAKAYGTKIALLNAMQVRRQLRSGAGPKTPYDAATRAAALALLEDDKPPAKPSRMRGESEPVANTAASAILYSRASPEEQASWTQLYQTAPQLMPAWLRAAARTIAEGKPLPPAPDATHVPEVETTALVATLAGLAPEKMPAEVKARTPDQQLAVLLHLERANVTWPPALKKAQFQISEVTGDLAADLGAAKWKGRQLDEPLVAEILAAVEKAALDGKNSVVMVQPKGLLEGLAVSVQKSPQSITREQIASFPLELPADKPAPDGFASTNLFGGGVDPQMGGLGYFYPIWKDAATTKGWLENHRKKIAAAGGKEPEPGDPQARAMRNDPAVFEKAVKAIVELQPGARKAFQLRWMAARVVEKAEKSEESEPDEVPSL